MKHAPGCSEADLVRIASELARDLGPADRVLLEGPMGAGKSTFARALLEALGVDRPPEGSPTFAIAHEYRASRETARGASASRAGVEVIHLDLYRLRSQGELEEAGVSSYFWERNALIIVEWLSLFENFRTAVLLPVKGRTVWQVELTFDPGNESRRDLRIERV